jgi:hypothetical protein
MSMEPTRGDYDITSVDGYSQLKAELEELSRLDSHVARVEKVSEILMNGYPGVTGFLNFGNNKISKNTGIFNMNSATDCPNANSTKDNQSDTGVCQVPWEDCYAHVAEKQYNRPLPKRRLQEFFWDSVDAQTFADALLRVKDRKRSAFEYLRVSEAGDFRHRGDIVKWDTIAEIVSPEIQVYTYSASHKLDWSEAEHFVVNQSNNLADYGDRLFSAVPSGDDVPDDAIFCPFEAAKENGVKTENRPKCGECTACIEPESEQSRDVYISLH